jgi:hypothetical protein
MYQRPPQPES